MDRLTREAHIALIQAGRGARAERLDPEALVQYELAQHLKPLYTPQAREVEGWIGDTYIARDFDPILPYNVVLGDPKDDAKKVRAWAPKTSPAKYPNLTAEEEGTFLDTDDALVTQAYNRYNSILAKVADAKKKKTGKALDKRLKFLRWEWVEVFEDTGVKHDDPDTFWYTSTTEFAVLEGREGQARIKRDEAEVSYCHRDPSDWQITHERSEAVRDAITLAQETALDADEDFTYEDAQDLATHLTAMERKNKVNELWKRLFADLGEDWEHGRIVTAWVTHPKTGKYLRPKATIGKEEFVARKIAKAGDELVGLGKAVDSLRFRVIAKREREFAKAAAAFAGFIRAYSKEVSNG